MPSSHYNVPPLARNLENIKCGCNALVHGVQFPPIFSAESALIIPDTLHMCLRILHRLLKVENFDCERQVRDPRAKSDSVPKFVDAIRERGVKFAIWQDKKKGRMLTSLSGGDCQKLLSDLPAKLKGRLYQDTESSVLFLWKTF